LPSYLRDANDRACLLVQVETLTALQRVTEIAEVPGVDGVFIGPADLAASLGHLGEPAHADVRLLIAVGIERIIAAGKPPGILCTDEKLAHEYVSMGARFVAIGVDTTLLANSARALVTRFRSGSDTAPSRAAAGY
jgi:4-hydroxy-2-oxoheptanedioate aldolase